MRYVLPRFYRQDKGLFLEARKASQPVYGSTGPEKQPNARVMLTFMCRSSYI